MNYYTVYGLISTNNLISYRIIETLEASLCLSIYVCTHGAKRKLNAGIYMYMLSVLMRDNETIVALIQKSNKKGITE